MQIYKTWRNTAKVAVDLLTQIPKIRIGLLLFLFLFCGKTVGDNEKWLPYTTGKHAEMGLSGGFADRLTKYLKEVKNLRDQELKEEFKRWNGINLGHIFEEVALIAYGVPKNEIHFNGRIPDGVEDGFLEQMAQYTHYPNSTFIEVKYMKEISFSNDRICEQIKDMINYLSIQETHYTTHRLDISPILATPRKASEEEFAILVFITPSNTSISNEIISYANDRQVKIYQQTMLYNLFNSVEVKLSKPEALTEPSRHVNIHTFFPKKAIVNWKRQIIDPDTGKPILGY